MRERQTDRLRGGRRGRGQKCVLRSFRRKRKTDR